MRLTVAYSKIKKRNLVLINNDTHQRETVSERPIRPPLIVHLIQDLYNVFLVNHHPGLDFVELFLHVVWLRFYWPGSTGNTKDMLISSFYSPQQSVKLIWSSFSLSFKFTPTCLNIFTKKKKKMKRFFFKPGSYHCKLHVFS